MVMRKGENARARDINEHLATYGFFGNFNCVFLGKQEYDHPNAEIYDMETGGLLAQKKNNFDMLNLLTDPETKEPRVFPRLLDMSKVPHKRIDIKTEIEKDIIRTMCAVRRLRELHKGGKVSIGLPEDEFDFSVSSLTFNGKKYTAGGAKWRTGAKKIEKNTGKEKTKK